MTILVEVDVSLENTWLTEREDCFIYLSRVGTLIAVL